MNMQNLTSRALSGPFDISELAEPMALVDFGSIKLPPTTNVELRLEIEEGTNRVVAVAIDSMDSTLQLQAFAAPKSEGVWQDVRSQLALSIKEQGGVVEERLGSFGPELLAKLPIADEHGVVQSHRYARFVGVDGPRWFLRGLIGGAAINDPAAASIIEGIFRSAVIDRGSDPIPPRDLLPLTVPPGVVTPPRGTIL
jgi:hypothetical protein